MARYALLIEYNGQQFAGWQAQKQLRTAQGELQQALSKIAAEPITVFCAGRTDRGVHAMGQVVHFDTEVERPLYGWLSGANSYMGNDMVVHAAQKVDDSFHARFSALKRRYRYVILNQPTRSAVHQGFMTRYCQPLDADVMHLAAQHLIGTHNFNALRATGCQAKSPIRTIFDIKVWREDRKIIMEVTANAFLHHMVRNIIGLLIQVGSFDRPVSWINEVIQSCDRTQAGVTAPPDGLYLVEIFYPTKVFS
jgi:tRNA pseudouridine38-40 synthase